jgi:DNA-binding NtrC family response regulator
MPSERLRGSIVVRSLSVQARLEGGAGDSRCEGEVVEAQALPFDAAPATIEGGPRVPGATMAELEKHAILATLDAVGGSTSRAAEMLDISARTIQYRLHEYGVAAARTKT